jgi:hypothetical protein
MEHLLMTLGVAEEAFGRGEVGATTDVLTAYRLLDEHGALVIGAHVNSANGVAMQGLRFGGQTKIAYTQDEHLHALEVTDLEVPAHRRSTARFFSGIKAEYPRRMHAIQGSDAHRLDRDPLRPASFGVGERATEVLVPSLSFQALKALFASSDFGRTRPARPLPGQGDRVKLAREEGNTATQAFHEHLTTKRTGAMNVLRDVVAPANTDGGTIFVGASAAEKRPIAGVADAAAAARLLTEEISHNVAPELLVEIETLHSDGKPVLAIRVPAGDDKPYALAPGTIFVREGGESVIASRDAIVAMVRSSVVREQSVVTPAAEPPVQAAEAPVEATGARRRRPARRHGGRPAPGSEAIRETSALVAPNASRVSTNGTTPRPPSPSPAPVDAAPLSGVEIVTVRNDNGVAAYSVRDLRTSEVTEGVTRESSRGLWHYAIEQREEKAVEAGHIRWKGDRGFWKTYRGSSGETRYNLAYRGDGAFRIFYGVSLDGMDADWRAVLPQPQPPES